MRDPAHVPISAAQIADDLLAVVGAVVVDEDDLVVDLELGEGLLQPFVHDGNGLRILVTSHHRGHAALCVQAELFG